jgi:hypothetical protein
MNKFATFNVPGAPYKLSDVYTWLANGAVTTRDRNTDNSAFCRYAPFYALKQQKVLARTMPYAIDEFWKSCFTIVNVLLKRHYGAGKGTQMSKARMSSADYDERTLDIVLFLIETWLPYCADKSANFTTLGDLTFFTFGKVFPYVLMHLDLLKHGIAEALPLEQVNQARYQNHHIAYTYWQRSPTRDPLQWLREHGFIKPRSKSYTIDAYMLTFARLSYCLANVPHTRLSTYHCNMTHLLGYTTPAEIHKYGEPTSEYAADTMYILG